MSLRDNLNKFDSQADKLAAATEKELLIAYSRTLKEIKGYMAETYEKYGTADKLTYTEMTKYRRLVTLEETLKKRIMALSGKNAKVLQQSLKDIYELAYYGTGFSLDQQVFTDLGANVGYLPLSEAVVIAAVNNPISGLTLNEILEKNRINLTYALKQEITQGLILGESYQKVAKRLTDLFEGDAVKAMRVAQTESHRVKNSGRFDSMQFAQAKGINLKKRWVSTLDKKTRKRHQELDGQEVGIDEPFKSDGEEAMYPGGFPSARNSVNCRCSHISVISGYEPQVRAARGEDGKTKRIKYMNYEEWKKAVEG